MTASDEFLGTRQKAYGVQSTDCISFCQQTHSGIRGMQLDVCLAVKMDKIGI